METYVSTDISRATGLFLGLIPCCNRKELGSFTRNLQCLPGAQGDPETVAWWNQPAQKEAWTAHRENQVQPAKAMAEYVDWVNQLPGGKPVFVGYPVTFDFSFVYHYMILFKQKSPFSFSALDVKTFAMAMMKCDYRQATKKHMPKKWFPMNVPHTHICLDDAREQGLLFINMLREHLGLER
jgi:hypothetical protein